MESLYKLLYKIKENPALFFGGRETVELLSCSIGGYLQRQSEIDGKLYGEYEFAKFQDFVQKKYNVISSQSWHRIIDFYSSSDREAFETFYKLLDEFLKNRHDTHTPEIPPKNAPV